MPCAKQSIRILFGNRSMHRHQPGQEVVAQGEMKLQPTSEEFLHNKQEENRNEFNVKFLRFCRMEFVSIRKRIEVCHSNRFLPGKKIVGVWNFCLNVRRKKKWLIAALSGHRWANNSCYFPTTECIILPTFPIFSEEYRHLFFKFNWGLKRPFPTTIFLEFFFCRHQFDR